MPSDERVQRALRATAGFRATYRAAVQSALARVRGMLAASGGLERARRELGSLGAARIDVASFAELSHGVTLDAAARARVAHAEVILRACADAAEEDFVVDAREARDAVATISSALDTWGGAFGAALTVDLVRIGQFAPAVHDRLTVSWPFGQWSKAHRMTAPAIVARVSGASCRPAALHALLDGAQHIALVVEGDCPPAMLTRLVTPGTLVLQTSDETGLDRFAAYGGPAIAALVPESAVCFLHDPEAGAAPWQRLRVWRRPSTRPRGSLGGLSAAQQVQEMLQLDALAAQPTLPDTAIEALGAAGPGDTVDQLASWLLAQSGVGASA